MLAGHKFKAAFGLLLFVVGANSGCQSPPRGTVVPLRIVATVAETPGGAVPAITTPGSGRGLSALPTPAATLVYPTASSTISVTHQVKPGESLSSIANYYGVLAADIIRANDLKDPNRLVAGQMLVIPGVAAPPTPIIHVVRPGENLYGIARKYGVSPEALASANGIADYNLIQAGQRLKIPR
ncbi:MAG: LysM peptidoglycan-binding domain-containing protein [Chloroflexota bacterium]